MGNGKGSQPLLENTKNAPKGHVSGVAEQGSGQEDIKHAPKGVFNVFNVRDGMRKRLNTTNTPLWVCLLGLA